MEIELKYLSWVSNRSTNQIMQLFELCGNSFEKLLELEAKIAKHHVIGCPSTKERVDEILSLPIE